MTFLELFKYEVDFVCHWDFWQTYTDRISSAFKPTPRESKLLKLVSEMSLMLVKMSI